MSAVLTYFHFAHHQIPGERLIAENAYIFVLALRFRRGAHCLNRNSGNVVAQFFCEVARKTPQITSSDGRVDLLTHIIARLTIDGTYV
jgi:hypothetical protein